MYQMRNESYAAFDPDEIRIGKGLLLFEKSRLLGCFNGFSDAYDDGNDVYPAKFKHYGVYTHNHVIDIISHVEPTIEKVNPKNIILSEKERRFD